MGAQVWTDTGEILDRPNREQDSEDMLPIEVTVTAGDGAAEEATIDATAQESQIPESPSGTA